MTATSARVEATLRRREAARKGAATRKRMKETRAAYPDDMGPDSPLRGTVKVDGDVSNILARLRARQFERSL